MVVYKIRCIRDCEESTDHNSALGMRVREKHGLFTVQDGAGIAGLRPFGVNSYFAGPGLTEEQIQWAEEFLGYRFVPKNTE